MAESKRFFWLKLKEDFFKDETMEWLEEQSNGKEYLLFYLKLCLMSLKHNGRLYREIGNMTIPYDADKLAEATKTPVDTVRVATRVLVDIGLVQQMDDMTLFMNQLESMVGSAVDSPSANKKRRQREKRQLRDKVSPQIESKCPTEYRDKSIENRDKSIEGDIGDKSPKTPSTRSKKSFTPPTLEEINEYLLERGIHNVSAKAFYDYYEAGDWYDAKGNKVKSWKQKLLTWARHEHGNTNSKPVKKTGMSAVDEALAMLDD